MNLGERVLYCRWCGEPVRALPLIIWTHECEAMPEELLQKSRLLRWVLLDREIHDEVAAHIEASLEAGDWV